MLKIAICDDERIYIEELQRLIATYALKHDVRCSIDAFSAPEQLLTYLQHNTPDALFLDIRMAKMDGLNLAKSIRDKNINCPLVFVSAHADYMQAGYEVRAFRYILKHQLAEALPSVMDDIRAELMGESFRFTQDRQTVALPIRNILYLESVGRRIRIICGDMSYEFSGTLDAAQHTLSGFIRCHKGFLINPVHVRRFNTTQITLSNENIIPVGRKFSAAALSKLTRRVSV